MDVEYHVLLLHFFEDRIELFVRHDPLIGVSGDAMRVRLDAGDSAMLSFLDGIRCHLLMEIQRHQESHVGLKVLELLLVVECVTNGCDWWYQVWLRTESEVWLQISLAKIIPSRRRSRMSRKILARVKSLRKVHVFTLTPPERMVGTTRLLMSPCRRWTCMSAAAGNTSPSNFSRPILL